MNLINLFDSTEFYKKLCWTVFPAVIVVFCCLLLLGTRYILHTPIAFGFEESLQTMFLTMFLSTTYHVFVSVRKNWEMLGAGIVFVGILTFVLWEIVVEKYLYAFPHYREITLMLMVFFFSWITIYFLYFKIPVKISNPP